MLDMVRSTSEFVSDEGREGVHCYVPARNDPQLNNYPKKLWFQEHRANIYVYVLCSAVVPYHVRALPSMSSSARV